MTSLFLFTLLFLFLLMGVPIAFSLGLASILTILFFTNDSLASMSLKLFDTMEHYTLLAIPFFILASAFLTTGGVARRLIRFAIAAVGHLRGGLAIASVAGSVLNPYLVGLSAGAGSALGELSGYLAGSSGRAVIQDRERYERIVAWMRRHGLWVIFVLSLIPNPLFDLAGIAAGALRIPVHHFLLACWLGKTVKTTVFALGGDALLASFLSR